jgi:hypothetical protein
MKNIFERQQHVQSNFHFFGQNSHYFHTKHFCSSIFQSIFFAIIIYIVVYNIRTIQNGKTPQLRKLRKIVKLPEFRRDCQSSANEKNYFTTIPQQTFFLPQFRCKFFFLLRNSGNLTTFHLRNYVNFPLFPICGTMDTYCGTMTATLQNLQCNKMPKLLDCKIFIQNDAGFFSVC